MNCATSGGTDQPTSASPHEVKFVVDAGGYPPLRATVKSIGFDLSSPETIVVNHQEVKLINLHLKVEIPSGYGGFLKMRSSIAKKGGIILGGVIDTDYRGDLIACLSNVTTIPLEIAKGDRFVQLVIFKTGDLEMTFGELSHTARAQGGFGSTGV